MDQKHLQQVSELWGLDGPMEFIHNRANQVYRAQGEGQELFIRLTHPTRRDYRAIRAEIEFLNHVNRHLPNVVCPVLSKRGNFVERVESHYCVVSCGLNGKHIEEEEITSELFESLGEEIALLHLATENFTSKEEGSRHTWKDLIFPLIDEYPNCDPSPLPENSYNWIAPFFASLPQDLSTFNLIHADLHLKNLLKGERNQLYILDFDAACYHWFIYDLAVTLFHALHDYPFQYTMLRASLLKGYLRRRPLDQFWMDHLDTFIQFRAFSLILWSIVKMQKKAIPPCEAQEINGWVRLGRKLLLGNTFQ